MTCICSDCPSPLASQPPRCGISGARRLTPSVRDQRVRQIIAFTPPIGTDEMIEGLQMELNGLQMDREADYMRREENLR